MTTTRIRLVEELFQTAADLPAKERPRFLTERCGSDAGLRREVEALLRHEDEAPEAFLAGQLPADTAAETDLSGRDTERYEILRKIGEGGMGTVYEARQKHPRRDVALKLIRSAKTSPEILRRFRHEADVLAGLLHPGIAQIYEAGTADFTSEDGERTEQPYFAMELVRGQPLDAYAARLDLRDKVELVARICDAVQHAHLRGVIHRDLKPDNILVVGEAGVRVGQPKVLDFGIARVAGPEKRQSTLETRAGHLIGTLEHMSPEQVGGDPREIDTRSDVYALGTILFELVSGRPPIDVGDTPLLEAARRIKEDEPARLRSFAKAAPAELEWICLRALEKSKQERYPTAGELATDLRRFLAGEPVLARSHSTFYVLRKNLRRHRTAAAMVALILVLLTTFAVVAGIQAARNRRLASNAEEELAVSNIERGRLFGLTGNLMGEPLLWQAFLRDPSSPHAFWGLWEFHARLPALASTLAHAGEIRAIEASPDGRWLASGGLDGFVRLWDVDDHRELAALPGASPVYSISVAPDSRQLAAGYEDGRILLWDVERAEELAELSDHSGLIHALDHDPEGERLVSGSADGTVRVWDLRARTCVDVLDEHAGRVWSVCFSPDGKLLATAGADATVKLWEAAAGPSAATLTAHEREVITLAFEPAGRVLFSGGQDKLLYAWDVETRSVLRRLEPHNGTIRQVWTSHDGAVLHVLGWKRVDRLRLPDLEPLRPIPLDWKPYVGASSLRDDRVVIGTIANPGQTRASDGFHGVLRTWDVAPDRGLRRFDGHENRACVALSPAGDRLVTGDGEGTVRVFDVAAGTLLHSFRAHADAVRCIRFHPTRELFATGGSDGALHLWDASSWKPVLSLNDFNGLTNQALDFSQDGNLLAATLTGARFGVYEVEGGREVLSLSSPSTESIAIRLAPDGETLATIAREPRVQLWDMQGTSIGSLETTGGGQWNLAFSLDGQRLLAGTWTNEIQVWDLSTRRPAARLEGHGGVVWCLDSSLADPDLVVSGSEDGTLRLWSLALRRNVATFDAFGGLDVSSVALSADGRTLAAAGYAPEVVVWDLEYPQRHMAGNLRYRLEELRPELGDVPAAELLEWTDEVLARPWPRWDRER